MLKRKMIRDIKNNLSQFITIFLMVMIGVMAYSGIKAYMDGMTKTADKFYSENKIITCEKNDLRESWLVLSNVVYNTNMMLLNIMGIEVPEKM